MANTTSGTVTFDKTFAVDEIIQEAYERIGISAVSGYQLKTARRSLNILFQEWGNRGIHYWEVADANIDLIEQKIGWKPSSMLTDWLKEIISSKKIDEV